MKEFCIVGSGNMGKAIASGILKKGLLKPHELVITDLRENQFREFCEKTGISGTCDNAAAVRESRTVILAVKPQYLADAADTFRDQVAKDTLVVSIAAGRTLAELAALFPGRTKLVRVMPNVAAMVLESMSAVSANEYVTREELQRVMDIFNSFGKAEEVPESMMDAVVGVSGSSPAYVCMLVEAMADAAVMGGMPRAQAYRFAQQAVLGSAKMLLETGMHPGAMKDMVCSPKGTTIEAVSVLEARGFRGAVMEAVDACIRRSEAL